MLEVSNLMISVYCRSLNEAWTWLVSSKNDSSTVFEFKSSESDKAQFNFYSVVPVRCCFDLKKYLCVCEMYSICGLSILSWGVLGGLISAAFGAFCGWLLFPALIAINVEQVCYWANRFGLKMWMHWTNISANGHQGRNRAIRPMDEDSTSDRFQSLLFQCYKS